MPLPTFQCPVCRCSMSAEVVFANEGINEAVKHLVNLHPEGRRLLRPALDYVGLFAPVKTEMRRERVAAVLRELSALIHAGTVSDAHGREWAAPLDYWRQALEEMVARRDSGALKLPLKSHGYLTAIVVGMSGKAAASAERHTEAQRAGHAGSGTSPERAQAVTISTPVPRAVVPTHVRQDVLRAAGSRRADNLGETK